MGSQVGGGMASDQRGGDFNGRAQGGVFGDRESIPFRGPHRREITTGERDGVSRGRR